jgi:putative ABC transport system permease protein
MIRITLRGLLTRKLRAFLTASAIVLGVAMVCGTYMLTDTIQSAFDSLVEDSRHDVAVVITGKKTIDWAYETPTVSDSLIARAREVSGVKRVSGSIEGIAQLIDSNGKAVNTYGAPAIGIGVNRFDVRPTDPTQITEGRWPEGPGEVALEIGSAERRDLRLGQRIRIASQGASRPFTIVGLAKLTSMSSIGQTTLSFFELKAAQSFFEMKGRLSEIDIEAKPGVTPESLVAALKPIMPKNVEVRTAAEQVKKDKAEIGMWMNIIRYFLLVFGFIALFVGAFVIFNTLSITVAQRTRELATLRTLGASRRQVLGSVLVEGLTIGAIASVVGLALGIALAKGLSWLFKVIRFDLPQAGTVLLPRTIVLSLLVGIVVTLIASLAPALRATRVPPIAAVREGAILPKRRHTVIRTIFAVLLLLIGAAGLFTGLFAPSTTIAQRLTALGGGCVALFFGVALLSSHLVPPLARLVGAPGALIGRAAGRLARENAVRAPGRTAATAAALMIGLALVVFVSVLARGLTRSTEVTIGKNVYAPYIVSHNDGYTPISNDVAPAIDRVPGVKDAVAIRSEFGKTGKTRTYVAGVDPESIASVWRMQWKQGSDESLAQLRGTNVLVKDSFAKKKKLAPGSTFEMLSPSGKTLRLRVIAIDKQPEFAPYLGDVTLSTEAFDGLFSKNKAATYAIFVNVSREAGFVEDAMDKAVADFPTVKVMTKGQYIDLQNASMQPILAMFYVLLGLSIVISVFGVINTLILAVFERTREIGMLRAVGMTRRQTRRMIRHEGVTISLIAAALGMPLGILLGALVTSALSKYGVVFSISPLQMVIFVALTVCIGILASILPARRASRLNVLEALQYE